ncbi:MAG: hypothetical protein ACKPE1_22320, partial [Dolichospermum sp.]
LSSLRLCDLARNTTYYIFEQDSVGINSVFLVTCPLFPVPSSLSPLVQEIGNLFLIMNLRQRWSR